MGYRLKKKKNDKKLVMGTREVRWIKEELRAGVGGEYDQNALYHILKELITI